MGGHSFSPPEWPLFMVSFLKENCDLSLGSAVSTVYYANNFFNLPQISLGKTKEYSRYKPYFRRNRGLTLLNHHFSVTAIHRFLSNLKVFVLLIPYSIFHSRIFLLNEVCQIIIWSFFYRVILIILVSLRHICWEIICPTHFFYYLYVFKIFPNS